MKTMTPCDDPHIPPPLHFLSPAAAYPPPGNTEKPPPGAQGKTQRLPCAGGDEEARLAANVVTGATGGCCCRCFPDVRRTTSVTRDGGREGRFNVGISVSGLGIRMDGVRPGLLCCLQSRDFCKILAWIRGRRDRGVNRRRHGRLPSPCKSPEYHRRPACPASHEVNGCDHTTRISGHQSEPRSRAPEGTSPSLPSALQSTIRRPRTSRPPTRADTTAINTLRSQKPHLPSPNADEKPGSHKNVNAGPKGLPPGLWRRLPASNGSHPLPPNLASRRGDPPARRDDRVFASGRRVPPRVAAVALFVRVVCSSFLVPLSSPFFAAEGGRCHRLTPHNFQTLKPQTYFVTKKYDGEGGDPPSAEPLPGLT